MKRVSGLHVVDSRLAQEEEEEPLPPKNGTPGNGASRPSLDRNKLTRLLKERRYEEALDMLLRARQQAPDDPTISRSVRLLKDKLTLKYAEAVGSLDIVVRCTIPDAALSSLSLSFEERGVLALVDGIATFGDVVDASPHGRFATYRALATFLEKGIVARSGKESTPIPTPVVANRGRPPAQHARAPVPPPPMPEPEPEELRFEPVGELVTPPPAPPPAPAAKRAPIRFQEVTPPMVAEALGNFSTPAQIVPIDTTGGQQPWDDTGDIDADYLGRDPKEQTQPMFQLAALVAAGAMPATMAPAAPAPQAAPVAVIPTPVPPPPAAGPQVSSKPGVDYDALFERATRAYVRRSYDEAMTLFEEYLLKRPDDRRALHNLEQLRKRRKGS
ncbi:MAG TPA: hypothetical protein VFA20_21395 [Myxococcaceae bacterium]|nr:hypothetical protein [Myxococcaceae bacterium]